MHCNYDKSKPKTTHGIAKTGRCIFKSPSVIQLSLNDKPTNRPESSDAWGSGAGLGGGGMYLNSLACSEVVV